MKQEDKDKVVKLIKDWQEKRPNFSRSKLSEATGVAYSILLTLDKEGLIKLPAKKPTTSRTTPWGNLKA